MRVIREFSNVIACAPVLEGSATVETDFQSEVFRLQGIDLDAQLRATDLRSYMASGDLADFRQKSSGLLLGSLLAQKMGVQVGSTVSIIGPGGDARSFEVCGVFRTGDNLIDEKRGFIHLRVAQSLFNKPANYCVGYGAWFGVWGGADMRSMNVFSKRGRSRSNWAWTCCRSVAGRSWSVQVRVLP